MLGFVQSFFSPASNPIGVDFGSDSLRLAQVQRVDGDYRLIAAACAQIPDNLNDNPRGRLEFFVHSVREILSHAPFRGRQAVLALPASETIVRELRMKTMDESHLKRSLPKAAKDCLPFDSSDAILRHIVAGPFTGGGENEQEVIVIGAAREEINQLLAAAGKARLDVIGMNVEPMAIVDCFGHVYRRRGEEELAEFFVDIGRRGTRAMISQSGKLRVVRHIAVGGDDFNNAVAARMSIPTSDARTLRIKLASAEQSRAARTAMANATTLVASRPGQANMGLDCPREEAQQSNAVQAACLSLAGTLIEKLDGCRKYYETHFSGQPIDRMIFIGGEARQRRLCHDR